MKTEDELREWAASECGCGKCDTDGEECVLGALIVGYREGAKDAEKLAALVSGALSQAKAAAERIDQLHDELHGERRAHDNARWREAQARVKALEEVIERACDGDVMGVYKRLDDMLTQARKGL